MPHMPACLRARTHTHTHITHTVATRQEIPTRAVCASCDTSTRTHACWSVLRGFRGAFEGCVVLPDMDSEERLRRIRHVLQGLGFRVWAHWSRDMWYADCITACIPQFARTRVYPREKKLPKKWIPQFARPRVYPREKKLFRSPPKNGSVVSKHDNRKNVIG